MGNFNDKVQRFMYGRNGNDKLNNFIFFLYIITFILFLIFRHISLVIAATVLLIINIYRTFSKKLYVRQKENEIYVKFITFLKRPFLRLAHKFRDRKTHVYKKCKSCKKVLKLKRVKGHHTVKCPVCKNSFKINIRK